MKTIYSSILTIIVALSLFLYSFNSFSQDTFSICAFDSVTGQVGSAGATCIAGTTSAIIISDVHPGVGVVHTQAYWIPPNQAYGKALMDLGTLTAQMIVDSLRIHDAGSTYDGRNSSYRQYGVVDLLHKTTAQHTGANCDNYKSYIKGIYYSIQGNTLLGQQILDSMQSRFLNTQGTLACRLMAALQGAKVIGADNRCTPYGISTFSAFIRVANPTDNVSGPYYLDRTINTYKASGPWKEPIDSLQALFNNWGGCAAAYVNSITSGTGIKVFPNPFSQTITIEANNLSATIGLFNSIGALVKTLDVQNQKEISFDVSDLRKGVYFLRVSGENGDSYATKLIKE